jgi:hypothetical protein
MGRRLYNMLANKTKMKKMLMLAPLVAVMMTACQPPMPAVPPSNRQVVAPKGSSDAVKPWNNTTRKEGEAVLGPLGDMNRR